MRLKVPLFRLVQLLSRLQPSRLLGVVQLPVLTLPAGLVLLLARFRRVSRLPSASNFPFAFGYKKSAPALFFLVIA